MTYEEAVRYISDIPRFTTKNKLEHTRTFLTMLGVKEETFKIIHVAGTNGKGSVCAYLDAMLRSEGKRVGLFTSPHLVKMNERIVIDGEDISDEDFLEAFQACMDAIGKMKEVELPHPTFFEFLFGLGMYAFAKAGVEYIVLETGLGGRLDATNSFSRPIADVITSIGYDHMYILGDRIEQIAGEKAGIIKPLVPVFYSKGIEEAADVIEKTAVSKGSACKAVSKEDVEIISTRYAPLRFRAKDAAFGGRSWSLDNTAIYQAENAMLALEVMRYLFQGEVHDELWADALARVHWTGRMDEVLPGIYIDGAHNKSAIERFVETADPDDCIIMFSAVEDKDYEEMIRLLTGKMDAEYYLVTRIDDGRAADLDELTALFKKYTEKPVIKCETLGIAWNYLMSHRESQKVYCLGSLYLVGMLEDYLHDVLKEK